MCYPGDIPSQNMKVFLKYENVFHVFKLFKLLEMSRVTHCSVVTYLINYWRNDSGTALVVLVNQE